MSLTSAKRNAIWNAILNKNSQKEAKAGDKDETGAYVRLGGGEYQALPTTPKGTSLTDGIENPSAVTNFSNPYGVTRSPNGTSKGCIASGASDVKGNFIDDATSAINGETNVGAATQDEANNEQTQAASDAGIAAAQEALANSKAAKNAGVSRMGSSMIGNTASTKDSSQQAITAANQANNASTQADWLSTQGYLQGLQNNLRNEQKGRPWNIAGAALSGIGAGAQLGAAVSDVNEKQAPSMDISDADLYDKIDKFMDLYKQLQELKGGKE